MTGSRVLTLNGVHHITPFEYQTLLREMSWNWPTSPMYEKYTTECPPSDVFSSKYLTPSVLSGITDVFLFPTQEAMAPEYNMYNVIVSSILDHGSPDLLKGIVISGRHSMNSETLCHIASRFRNLRVLRLRNTPITTEALMTCTETLRNLEVLDVFGCLELKSAAIHAFAERCSNLKVLCIDGVNVSDDALTQVILKCTMLESLSINDGFTDASLGLLATTSPEKLKCLMVSNAPRVSDASMKEIAEHCVNLTDVVLARTNVTKPSFERMLQQSKTMQKMVVVSVEDMDDVVSQYSCLTYMLDKTQLRRLSERKERMKKKEAAGQHDHDQSNNGSWNKFCELM